MKHRGAWGFLLAFLVISGCSRTSAPSMTGPDLPQQLSDLRVENETMKEQLKNLERERAELRKQLTPDSTDGQINVGREKAIDIAHSQAPDFRVAHARLVEFPLREPDRRVAVWVLEDGEQPRSATIIIDAVTGQVLNVTNAPTGQ